MVGSLLGRRCGGWGTQAGVELGQRPVSPLAVLLEGLRLHHLTTVAAHHQVEVIVTGVQAEDGHVLFTERHGFCSLLAILAAVVQIGP